MVPGEVYVEFPEERPLKNIKRQYRRQSGIDFLFLVLLHTLR